MKNLLLLCICTLLYFLTSCSTEEIASSNVEIASPNIINNIGEETLEINCLEESPIDSFIFYANEFTNILNSTVGINIMTDSANLINLAENSNINSIESYYTWVESVFGVPTNITERFAYYSNQVLPLLQQEDQIHHPIADRYYYLLESGCIISNIEYNGFYSSERGGGCGFWNLTLNTWGLAASVAGAVTVEVWTLGVGTVVAVSLATSAYGFGSALVDCL